MKDFAGREVKVGDRLAVSPARSPYLYGCTVEAIETVTLNSWNGHTRQVEPTEVATLVVRLDSNGRKQRLDERDGYVYRIVVIN